MPDRDLDITKFSFFAYRKLKKTLGEFDAVVECNEIAVKEFLEHARKEDVNKYIKRLSLKHKVKVDEVDFYKFTSRIRQYYISSVFQQSEQFLKDFKEEWIKYHPNIEWLDLNKGETKFQNTIRNISVVLSPDLIDIYEYYRIIRNYMSHTDRDIHELKKRLAIITKNKNEFLKDFYLTDLPNELDYIDFNDFLILTNIIKHVTYIFSTNSKPDNKRIAEILFDLSKENNKRSFKGLKKLKNDEIRYDKAIKNYIASKFGRFSVKDLEDVSNEFKSLLA